MSSSRRRPRRSRADGALDTSAWSSSLYSAREPSHLSSIYLRPFEDDASLGHSNVSNRDDASLRASDLGHYGSLLLGSQRSNDTSQSYVGSVPETEASAHDYADEEKFMAQVDSEWLKRGAEPSSEPAPASPLPDAMPSADDSVFVSQRTPQVPGLFRSVLRSQAPAFDAESEHKAPPNVPSSSLPRRGLLTWACARTSLLILCLTAMSYVLLFGQIGTLWRPGTSTLFSSKPFSPPSSPAALGELQHRVGEVEGALNKVWRSLGQAATEFHDAHQELEKRMSGMEHGTAVQKSIKALERDVQELQRRHAEEMKRWYAEKADLERTLRSGTPSGTGSQDTTAKRLASLESKLVTLERLSSEAQQAANDAQRAIAPLRDLAPDKMPVRYDLRTGKVRIEPSFWREFHKKVGKGHADSPASIDWDTFVAQHQDELTEWLQREAHALVKDGILLDKDTFLELMKAEIVQAKTELSAQFNENVHGLQQETLAKVREQQSLYEQSGSWSPPSRSPDMDLDAVKRLIDAALAKFAADQIGEVDFAQYSAGGRVVPRLTSPTHEIRMPGANMQSWSWVLSHIVPLPVRPSSSGSHIVRGRMPVVALHHDTSPGMCWPFSGSHGQLGIQLIQRVFVRAITIDHIPASLALDGRASAPRDVEVWGVVSSDEERVAIQRWHQTSGRSLRKDPAPIPPSPSHVFLGAFSYDARADAPAIQTFPLGEHASALPFSFRVLQLHVLSNHGMREFTCLYRVRVHGEPAEPQHGPVVD